jgi:hypothetical protein
MLLGLGLMAVSAALLITGVELFTENAAGAARRLGITVFGRRSCWPALNPKR